MKCPFLLSGITLENPPWVDCQGDEAAASPTVVIIDSFAFTKVLQTKLLTLSQEVRSPEFNRQALLAVYDCTSLNTNTQQVFDLSTRVGPQLYDAYGVPIPRQPILPPCGTVHFTDLAWSFDLDVFGTLAAPSNSYILAQLLLLHLVSFLIDEIAAYWKQIVRAREVFRFALVLIALRHQHKCGFLVRSFHTPLRFSRRSIHPIASAA